MTKIALASMFGACSFAGTAQAATALSYRGVPPVPDIYYYDSASVDADSIESALTGTTVLDGGVHVVDRLGANGTATSPVMLKCINGAQLTDPARGEIRVTGSYLIIAGCTLNNTSYFLDGEHIAVRGGAVKFSPRTGIIALGSNIVIGGVDVEGSGIGVEQRERHGITVGPGSDGVWIIDNTLHGNTGDGVQFCHRCEADPPKNVYVAGNRAFGNRENGIDLKYAHGVVISGNEVYGHSEAPVDSQWCYQERCGVYGSGGSDGAGVLIGSDGDPTHVAMFDNTVRDNGRGVRIEGSIDPILIGNQITGNQSAGIVLDKRGGELGIINNTIAGSEYGILQTWRDQFCLDVRGNTFEDNDRDVYLKSSRVRRCSYIETSANPTEEDDYQERFESWFGRSF